MQRAGQPPFKHKWMQQMQKHSKPWLITGSIILIALSLSGCASNKPRPATSAELVCPQPPEIPPEKFKRYQPTNRKELDQELSRLGISAPSPTEKPTATTKPSLF